MSRLVSQPTKIGRIKHVNLIYSSSFFRVSNHFEAEILLQLCPNVRIFVRMTQDWRYLVNVVT